MNAIRFLLRIFAYLYHSILCLCMLGLGVVGWLADTKNFNLPMIPGWTDAALIRVLIGGGVVGLISVLLAVRGKTRILLIVWGLVVIVEMVRGFFLGSYTYDGLDDFKQALGLTAGAIIAWAGAVISDNKKTKSGRR